MFLNNDDNGSNIKINSDVEEKKGFFDKFKKKKNDEDESTVESFYQGTYHNNTTIDVNNMPGTAQEETNIEPINYEIDNNYDSVLNPNTDVIPKNVETRYNDDVSILETKLSTSTVGLGIAAILLIIGIGYFVLTGLVKDDVRVFTNINEFGMVKGDSHQLDLVIFSKKGASFETSDINVCAVNSATGYLTAKKSGQATITIRDYNGDIQDKVVVNVVKSKVELKDFTVPDSIDLALGEESIIKISLDPNDATSYFFTYTSNNSDIVTIDSIGKLTGKQKGNTSVVVASQNISKTIEINVK